MALQIFGGGSTRAGMPTYAPGAPSGRFDPARDTYNLKASNTKRLRAALARARSGAGAANILCLGDSETSGYPGGAATSYPRVLRDSFTAAGYPLGGDGMVYVPSNGADTRWSFAASGFANANPLFYSCASAGKTATFTSEVASTALDIYTFGNSGAWSYAVDGGASVPITPPGSQTITKTTVTGLANTTHTVVITTVAATSVFLIGVRTYSPTGLHVDRAGIVGKKTADFLTTSFSDAKSIIPATTGTPDVVLISLTVNDSKTTGGDTVANAKANLASIRALWPSADAILVTQLEPDATVTTNFNAYLTAQFELADSLDLPLIDTHARFGTYVEATAAGLTASDHIHESPAGYRLKGHAVFGALTT